jgi:hypothetical protein
MQYRQKTQEHNSEKTSSQSRKKGKSERPCHYVAGFNLNTHLQNTNSFLEKKVGVGDASTGSLLKIYEQIAASIQNADFLG